MSTATLTPALCVLCDAPRGKCYCGALFYTDPIAYKSVPGGWKIPEHELARLDTGPALQAQLRARDERSRAKAPKVDPSICSGCGDSLATFQIVNGFTRCSTCYRKASSNS